MHVCTHTHTHQQNDTHRSTHWQRWISKRWIFRGSFANIEIEFIWEIEVGSCRQRGQRRRQLFWQRSQERSDKLDGMDEEGQNEKVAYCHDRNTENKGKQFCIGSWASLEASEVFWAVMLYSHAWTYGGLVSIRWKIVLYCYTGWVHISWKKKILVLNQLILCPLSLAQMESDGYWNLRWACPHFLGLQTSQLKETAPVQLV